MIGWRECRLGDLCEITRGASPRPIHEWISDIGTPWVKISDATSTNSRFIESTKEFIKSEGENYSVVVDEGDLILSNSATPGLPRFLKIRACIHDGWLLFRNVKNLDKLYLYYLLIADREKYVQLGNGSIFTNLKTEILKEHTFLLPPLPEQKVIAEVLSSLDDKIDLLTRQNKTLEDLAQTYFRKWFVEDASEDWEEKRLGEIITINYGKALPERERVSGNIPVYSSAGATGWHNHYLVNSCGIVIGRKGTIGTIYWVSEPFYCIDTAFYITPKDSKYDLIFIYYLLQTLNLHELNEDSAVPGLNRNTVYSQEILVPRDELVDKFLILANTVMLKIQTNITQIRTLQKLRDTLLPKLISGEVRVKM